MSRVSNSVLSILQIFVIAVPISTAQASGLHLSNPNQSEVQLVSEISLQICSGAKVLAKSVELPSHFLDDELWGPNRTIVFKLASGEPQCSTTDRKVLSESFHIDHTTFKYETVVENDPMLESIEDDDTNLTADYDKADGDDHFLLKSHPQIRFNILGVLTVKLGDDLLYREVGDYCIQEISENLTVSFCNNICTERPCIPKCCELNQVLDLENSTDPVQCTASGKHKWRPKFHESHANSSSFLTEPEHSKIMPHIFYSPLKCQGFAPFIHERMSSDLLEIVETPEDLQLKDFRILNNGSLIVRDRYGLNSWETLQLGQYCVDGVQNYGKGVEFSGDSFKDVVLFQCSDAVEPSGEPERKNISKASKPMNDIGIVIYWLTIPVASLFLLLTIVVYIAVWDIHNIHGYILFSYLCSLFGFYLFLFLSQIRAFTISSTGCAATGVGIHLFFLITACWLTTINFDVWWTFRVLSAGQPSRSLKRYFCYALFSFGVPIVIVVISVALNNQYKDDEASSPIIIPNYGKDVCALSNASVGYYLYTPVGILIGCNIIFFVWTICLLLHYKRSIGAALKGTVKSKDDQSLSVFLKLFIVMGISWISEIIGWAVQNNAENNLGISWCFAVLDIINVLMPVGIFIIFVCKRVIFERLWLKHPGLRPLLKLFIFGGCCDDPMKDSRPSFSGLTMSTLGRGGTIGGRKVSSGSVREFLADGDRKLSNPSRTFSKEETKP